ncbi:uncharacterized protein LOC129582617 [Paramacrobiotus metropolitanus]|uniref:uncharacterized protein LOC129582617 n=1 Tax=Paramacrobiotus metropolitanus TaxID=2943436 RepID=UPI002445638F|nr:uncharacterized protein LOC129582617 [Paramacrobiotus metropolitanus]XP_055330145.1 uncharacterized protein LOC129582617 [Paramacrobiotus metropolitanus]
MFAVKMICKPAIIWRLLGVIFFSVFISIEGNGLYDPCTSTLSCGDPGLTCHDGRCVCIFDKGPEAVQFWGCNNVLDCERPIRLAADQLSYAGHRLASEMLNVEEPQCIASEVCPNPRDRLGYCRVFWPDGDAVI